MLAGLAGRKLGLAGPQTHYVVKQKLHWDMARVPRQVPAGVTPGKDSHTNTDNSGCPACVT